MRTTPGGLVRPGRWSLLARQLVPSVASASQRASQLVVLWSLTAAADGVTQAQLLTGFGLIATFVTISDSGAGSFLLARRGEQLTASAFARACGVHVVVTLVGIVACAGFLAIVLQHPVSAMTVVVLVALALTQVVDNLSRVVRYPLLNREHNVTFAGPELICSVLKIGLAGWAGVSMRLLPLLGLPLVSVAVIVLAVRPVRRALHPADGDPPAVRAILTFGLAGAMSALYSQFPLIFASLLLSNDLTAVLATFMRVFQALEIVPSTLALQAMPRYAEGRRTLGRDWLAMSGGGVLLALAFLPFIPLLGSLLDLPLGVGLGVVFAGAFVARCGGYALAAFAMGTGRVDLRLRLTVLMAVVMLPLAPLMVHTLDLLGGALASLIGEVLLAGSLAFGLRRVGQPHGRHHGRPHGRPHGRHGRGDGLVAAGDPSPADRLPSS